MEIIFLGTGSSAGTPVIGCQCAVCHSSEPRNQRTRACVAVKTQGKVFLIDTSPDLRLQALRENLTQVDAVLFTHVHADHMHGIDDLRAFCFLKKQAIPIFGNEFTITHLRQHFAYALHPPTDRWETPALQPHAVSDIFDFLGIDVTPIPVLHGKWPILGYRIGNFAYLTDVSAIPASSFDLLQDLEVLALDCLRYTPHPTHFSFSQAIEIAAKIKAKHTYFIHMTHEIDYSLACSQLPPTVNLAYDGLRINL